MDALTAAIWRGRRMTREEAIEILQGAIKKPNTKDGYLGQAIDMAIKALEQETVSKESYDHEYFLRKDFEIKIAKLEHDKNVVLDKIRAEIADLDDADYDYEGYYKAVTDALKIIDKYKAESED